MNKRIIIFSLIACTVGTIVGYFCLFIGGHISHDTHRFSLFLVPGYVLMWPSLLYGYIQLNITGNNVIDYTGGIISQLIGYLMMGYILNYIIEYNKTHNK